MKTSMRPWQPLLVMAALLAVFGGPAAAKEAAGHGYLGVMLQDINASMAKALQLDEGVGVLVSDVVDDGPAEKAGLEDGDVILRFDDKDITDDHNLTKAVRAAAPGDKVKVEYLRNGKRKTVTVELGEAAGRRNTWTWRSDDEGRGRAPRVEFFGEGDEGVSWFGENGDVMKLHRLALDGDRGYMGVEMGDLSAQLGEYFGVEDGRGALVNSVRDDSPAAKAGLRAGDVIVAVGEDEVTDPGDVHAALAGTEAGDEVTLAVVRKGDRKTIKVTLAEMPEGEFPTGLRMLRAPRVGRHFGHDFSIPEGLDEDFQVIVPDGSRALRKVIRIEDDQADLDQMRAELDQLRSELKQLQKELKK